MANISVPSIAPGAKSLPSELKIRNPRNMVQRMKAQHSGISGLGVFPYQAIVQSGGKSYRLGMGRLRGLGQDDTGEDDSSIPLSSTDIGATIPVDTSISLPTVTLPATSTDITTEYEGSLENAIEGTGVTSAAPAFSTADLQTMALNGAILSPPAGYSGPTVVAGNATPPAAPTGYQWASVVNSAGQTLAKVMAVSQGGTSVTLPNGTQLLYGSPAAAEAGIGTSLSSLGTTLTSNMPLVLIVVGALIFLPMLAGGSKR
jgi:hypothetical protein